MKRIFSLTPLFLLFFTCSGFAQMSLRGIIKDDLNFQIIGAVVQIQSNESVKKTLSDLDGYFEFEDLGQKKYALIITSMGYGNYENEINLDEPITSLNIVLKPSTTQLQEIEVVGRGRKDYNSSYSFSATKIAIKNKELPQAISSVTKELMADRQAFQLADAVKIASGVIPSSFYNQFTIRGISQNEEGQIINGMRTRQFYFLQPLTTNIERIEVLKGPASVTFSSVDPGGSVNIVTKKPLTEDRKEVSLSVGSFSTIRGTLDMTGPLNESKTLLYRFNAAYQEAGSYRDHVGNTSILLSPSFSYIPNSKTAINTELIYSDMKGNLDRGQPIFGAVAGQTDLNSTPISLNLGAPNDFFRSSEFIWTANLTHKFTDRFSFNTTYMKQTWTEDLEEHRTINAFATDITGNPINSLVQMRYVQRQQFWNTDNFNTYFNYNFDLGKTAHKLLVGYDLQAWHKLRGNGQNSARGFLLTDGTASRSFDPDNSEAYQTYTDGGFTLPRPNVPYFDLDNPDYSIRTINDYVVNSRFAIPATLTTTHAIYLQEQIKIGRFSALLSLRNEWFEDITNRQTKDEKPFSNMALIPRIGLSFELNSHVNIYTTYLEGYQPQSNTVTLMPNTGNFFWASESAAQFDPLISDLKELGVKAELLGDRLTLNAAIYEINQKNILMSANDPENPDRLVQRGADRSRGFETDIAGYLMPNWQINASYSYIDAEIVFDADEALIGERKENTPIHSGNIWTRYNFENTSWFKDLGIGLGMQAQGSQIPWFSRAFEVPAFTIFDAAIYYTPLKSNMQIALTVNNLLNETYWLGAQTFSRLFPGAPRNFTLSTTFKFQ